MWSKQPRLPGPACPESLPCGAEDRQPRARWGVEFSLESLAEGLYYVVITWGSVSLSATFPAKALLELLWRLQNAPNPGMSPCTRGMMDGFSALSPNPNLYLHVHVVLEKPCSPQTQMLRTLFQGKISGSSTNTCRGASPCSLPLLPSVPCSTFLSFLWGSILHFIRLLSGSDNSSPSFPALSVTRHPIPLQILARAQFRWAALGLLWVLSSHWLPPRSSCTS